MSITPERRAKWREAARRAFNEGRLPVTQQALALQVLDALDAADSVLCDTQVELDMVKAERDDLLAKVAKAVELAKQLSHMGPEHVPAGYAAHRLWAVLGDGADR